MRKALLLVLMTGILLTGCEDKAPVDDGKINPPFDYDEYDNQNYQDVIKDFEDAGFVNIKEEALGDLITGWLTDEGEIEEITIDGEKEFSTVDEYLPDVEVVVSYHSFPSTEEETHEKKTTEAVVETENITEQNNEEFASVLENESENHDLYLDFSEKYKGEKIEFDGCITYVVNHDEYDTRYDVLLSSGDYIDENTVNPGPIFKFEDVNTFDMGIKDLYLPDFISAGSDVHVIAEVESYDSDSGLFFIDPITVTDR